MNHRLILARHGKAEPYGSSDHERELMDRGRQDAARLGAWLAEQQLRPDMAVVSSSTRTRQTWRRLADEAGWALEPTIEDSVYNAGPDSVLDVLRGAPADIETLVLLGHNPTVGWLANSLDDGEGDPDALMRVMQGFPPAACAVIELHGDWSDLADGGGRLVGSWRP